MSNNSKTAENANVIMSYEDRRFPLTNFLRVRAASPAGAETRGNLTSRTGRPWLFGISRAGRLCFMELLTHE